MAGFPNLSNYIKRTVLEVSEQPIARSPRITSWRYDVNVSKETMLMNDVDVGTLECAYLWVA